MPINDPTEVSGCILWCRAESLLGVIADGAPVSQWDDESGAGNHLTQSTAANQPLFEDAEPTFGWPALRGGLQVPVTGTRRWFAVPDALFTGLTAGELYFVLKSDVDSAGGGGNQEFSKLGADGFGGVYGFPADGNIYADFGTTLRLIVNPSPSLAAVRIYTDSVISGSKTLYLDGTQIATRASNTVSFGSAGTRSIMANRTNAINQYLNAYWYAVVIYNRRLTTTERADVVAYLQRYQAAFASPPDPPEITIPATDGLSFDRLMDIEIEDVSGTGSGGGTLPMTYKLEHENSTGAGWVTLSETSDRVFDDFDISTFPAGTDHRLRASAKFNNTAYSAVGGVRTFTVAHATTPPDTPSLDWQGWCGNFDLYFKNSAFSHPVPGATLASVEVEVAAEADPNFLAPLFSGDAGPFQLYGVTECTDLDDDTTYWARIRYTDDQGNVSEWSAGLRGKTASITSVLQIGVGDYGWGGGLAGLGLVVQDLSGHSRHGRHLLCTGGGGESFLNMTVAVWPTQFPQGSLTDNPAGFGSDDMGASLEVGGGRFFAWPDNDLSSNLLSISRQDGVGAVLPDFGLILLFTPHEFTDPLSGFDDELFVLGEAKDTASPIGTSPLLWIRLTTTGQLYMIRNGPFDVINLMQLEIGQPNVLRLTHKYTTETSTRSIIHANGVVVYNSTPWNPTGIVPNIGHFRLGTASSANISSPRNFKGVYSEAAFWWNEVLDRTVAADLPIAETVTLSPAAILATDQLELYWRDFEPGRPEPPVLSVSP